MTPVNLRYWLWLLLVLAACVCALFGVSLGFDLGWFGMDDGRDIPGWISLALLLFFASHLIPGRGKP